jgi:hypothetical protein
MGVTIIGIDLAKNLFRLHGCDEQGRAVLRKRLTRGQLLGFIAQVPACTVAMEACASAHYWAREIEQLGHRVRLVNPRFVKPYVKANKNDASDAEAICEAASRASMRFVPVKTAAQLEVQAVYRVRQQLVKSRTALINQVRGLLAEHGKVWPRTWRERKPCLPWPISTNSAANCSCRGRGARDEADSHNRDGRRPLARDQRPILPLRVRLIRSVPCQKTST